MASIDLCHREPEFGELTLANNAALERVYDGSREDYAAVTLTGSGTAAVEAMLGAFCPSQTKTLVAANGVYGERMAKMLTGLGRPSETVGAAWDEPIDLDAVDDRLRNDPSISHVATVHHETTSGRLNRIDELGALCHEHGCKLLLDAVSSFAAEKIEFARWNLEALAATANKCLHGVPGISFVVAQRSALDRRPPTQHSVYLDLHGYYLAQQAGGFSPFTQAVPSALALAAALEELAEQGGWERRGARYRVIGQRVRDTLRSAGVLTMLDEADYSVVLSSYVLPEGVAYGDLHDAMKKAGFIIYAGQGRFAESMFRIAHMGDIRDDDVDRLEQALTTFFGGMT
jgi:2-aminoethylphosphonate-pyruvate transaminase